MTEPDSAVSSERTGDSKYKLKYSIFYLTILKNLKLFTVKVIKHWKRLGVKVMNSSSLE